MTHIVRRRADLRQYLQVDTPFPERKETETSYKLSPEGHQLFDAALATGDLADEVKPGNTLSVSAPPVSPFPTLDTTATVPSGAISIGYGLGPEEMSSFV